MEYGKALVLMSTYNGEKYLREQIDSLLAQKDVDLNILIRDDGSTDGTIDIIKSYPSERISFYQGKNLGPSGSFMDLVVNAPEASYYAYCDQDDVWNEDKLITAIRSMEKESEYPVLYMSTYDVVDEKLDFMFQRDMKFSIPFSLESTIVERSPSACTMVFNHKLALLLKEGTPDFIRMHDYWTLMVAESFHCKIIGEDISLMKYRQHASNAVGIGTNAFIRIKRLLVSAIKGNNERQRQVLSLYRLYHDKLPEDSLKSIEQVVNYRKNISNRFRLARNKKFRTDETRTNFLFVVSVLMGVF